VTAWSWFGVNQMGQGLHAYGFRKGMTFWLIAFALSQVLVIAIGCLPDDWWRAKSTEKPMPSEA
ncbi:MAG: cytochrome C assembly protein, partial [Planctomycetota bacterium]